MLHAQHIFAIFANSCLPLHGAPDECYYNTLLCCEEYFLSSSVVSRASLRYACIRCSHPLGYLCAKFRFCGIHCWASLWRKIAYSITRLINHSLTHSLTHPAYLMPEDQSLHFGISALSQQFSYENIIFIQNFNQDNIWQLVIFSCS